MVKIMTTNFYGTVNIGTKVTVERGGKYIRTNVEPGGRYYEGVTEKEMVEKDDEDLLPPLTDEDIKKYIDAVSPQIQTQNQWFAIYKPLVWMDELHDADYEGAVSYIHRLHPEGLQKDFKADDIRKIDTFCFAKTIDKWSDETAPVHGARYIKMQAIASAFYNMLKQHEKRIKQ